MIRFEAWSSETAELTTDQAQLVAQAGLVSVEVAEPPNQWRLISDSRVGIVSGRGWEVRVVPRLAIPKLMFLLGYATDPGGWRNLPAAFRLERDFFAAIASGFAMHAKRAVEPAPVRGYVRVEEESTALRGRLRVADQISRSRGLALPLQIAYDDYELDIPENRILKTAADFLLRIPRLPTAARKTLRRVRATLEGVEPVPIPYLAEPPTITRLNQRYAPALALATRILRRASISTEKGQLSSASFVFDMNMVFEDFLSAALRKSLQRFGGTVRLQYGREHLDYEQRLRLIPDITWWKDGACRAVIDAKYKRLADARFPNADAYQMLAYCTAFGLDRGLLIYARDEQQRSRTYNLRDDRTEIQVQAIEVALEPEDLLAEVDRLAEGIVAQSDLVRDAA